MEQRFELRWSTEHGHRSLEVWELSHRDFTTRDFKPHRQVSLSHENVNRIRPALLEAMRANHLPPSTMAEWNVAPIRLDEEWGVRVGLMLRLVGPVKQQEKVQAMVEGVLAMGREEALYWYAKCFNGRGPHYTSGLRVCLAGGIGDDRSQAAAD